MLLQVFLLFVAGHAAGGEWCIQGTRGTGQYCEWGCCGSFDSGCCSSSYTYTYRYNSVTLIIPAVIGALVGLSYIIGLIIFCFRRRQAPIVTNADQPRVYTMTTV